MISFSLELNSPLDVRHDDKVEKLHGKLFLSKIDDASNSYITLITVIS